jgi:hypothetical protein
VLSDDHNKIVNQVQLAELVERVDKEIMVQAVNVVERKNLCNQLLFLFLKVSV